MRIWLKPSDTGTPKQYLAGQPGVPESEFCQADDVELDGVAVTQEELRVRTKNRRYHDRENVGTIVRWSTARVFASNAEAESFAITYDKVFSRSGTLGIEILGAGGAFLPHTIANAVVDPPRRKVIGCSVILRYEARGGQIS